MKTMKDLTGTGSDQDAPTMDGLTMATGRPLLSSTSRYSAKAFVYVYVFGRDPISLLVSACIASASIHLINTN